MPRMCKCTTATACHHSQSTLAKLTHKTLYSSMVTWPKVFFFTVGRPLRPQLHKQACKHEWHQLVRCGLLREGPEQGIGDMGYRTMCRPVSLRPLCFHKARSFANDAGLPFLITEYKDGLQGGSPIEGHPNNPSARTGGGHHGDLSYAAAFVMHNVRLLTDLDVWSYWTL